MEEVKKKATEFGIRYAEASSESEALSVKTEWANWRDTLSKNDRDVCVEAFVDASNPLSDAARALLQKARSQK